MEDEEEAAAAHTESERRKERRESEKYVKGMRQERLYVSTSHDWEPSAAAADAVRMRDSAQLGEARRWQQH